MIVLNKEYWLNGSVKYNQGDGEKCIHQEGTGMGNTRCIYSRKRWDKRDWEILSRITKTLKLKIWEGLPLSCTIQLRSVWSSVRMQIKDVITQFGFLGTLFFLFFVDILAIQCLSTVRTYMLPITSSYRVKRCFSVFQESREIQLITCKTCGSHAHTCLLVKNVCISVSHC